MRNFSSKQLLIAVLLCGFSFVNTSFIEPDPLASLEGKKVAIVTFYADKFIDASRLGGTASLISSVSTLSEDPDFNITPILEAYHKAFFEIVAKGLPFDLLDEQEVLGNEAYQAYESRFGETSDEERSKLFQRFVTIEGYKPLGEFLGKNSRNELKMLEIFKDKVDGVMFVYLDFAFNPQVAVAGIGSCKIQAFCRMKLWNKDGKKVFRLNEFANSKGSVGMVAGVPVIKTEKILPLCQDATERLIEDVLRKVPQKAGRVAKKL